MSAEVAASAVTHPPLVGMVEAGTIEIVAVGAERCAAGARWWEVGPDGAARAVIRVWRSTERRPLAVSPTVYVANRAREATAHDP